MIEILMTYWVEIIAFLLIGAFVLTTNPLRDYVMFVLALLSLYSYVQIYTIAILNNPLIRFGTRISFCSLIAYVISLIKPEPLDFRTERLQLMYKSNTYDMEIAIFHTSPNFHPYLSNLSMAEFDANKATFDETSYTQAKKEFLKEILMEIRSRPNVDLYLTPVSHHNHTFYSFSLFIVTYASNGEELPYLQAMDMLKEKFDNLVAIPVLKDIKSSQYNNFLSIDNTGNLNFNPTKLLETLNMTSNSFQLMKHELDLFDEIFEAWMEHIPTWDPFRGNILLGETVDQSLISINPPQNIVCLGDKQSFQQLQKSLIGNNFLVLTDNPSGKWVGNKDEDIQIWDVEDLSVDLLGFLSTNTAFFEELFANWEYTLSEDTRVFLRRSKSTGMLMDFLLTWMVNDQDEILKPIDLLHPATYTKFENDISSELRSKFKDILSLSLFNSPTGKQDLFSLSHSVINVANLKPSTRNIIVIMVLVAQQYRIFGDTWLVLDLTKDAYGLEQLISKVSEHLDFCQVMIYLQSIHQFNWLNHIELLAIDRTINSDKLERFMQKYKLNASQLFMVHNMERKTVLVNNHE